MLPIPVPSSNRSSIRTFRIRAALGLSLLLACVSSAGAQTVASANLRDVLTDLLRGGILLARPQEGADHSAHFIGEDSRQFQVLEQVNSEIARQLNTVPLSSSAGGFVFEIDPALGLPVRQSQSFGPIFAERPLTVGRGKFNLGLNYNRYTFDKFDGLDLRDGEITLLFVHEDVGIPDSLDFLAEGDVITSNLFLKINTSVTSFVATYGVADRFDVGLVVPIIDIDVSYAAVAQIQRLSTYQTPGTHQFPDGTSGKTIAYSGSAQGLGDITLRGKLKIASERALAVAGTAEVRFPTGDELDLLGTGAYQGKFSLLAAVPGNSVSPHINVGYAVASGSTLSDEIDYRLGMDWAVDPKMTLAADLIGQTLLSADRAYLGNQSHRFTDPQQQRILTAQFPVLFQESDQVRNRLQAALGAKINLTGNVLISGSGLIGLSDDGLTDDFSAMAGIDYSF